MRAAGLRPAALVLPLALLLVLVGNCSPRSSSARPTGAVIRVPADASTPAGAVAMAEPGDTILLAPGTYAGRLTVPGSLHDITIRGEDRATVVLDGRDRGSNAISIAADGVAVENLTIHSFPGNGIVWHDVAGYRASHVTVWNVGGYGIYAVGSRHGLIARSLVSGAADAAFYVGECHPCDAALRHDIAMLSGLGYSGTNAGGGLVVADSLFDRNGTGILPNSYDDEANPPQRDASFSGNRVVGSGTVPTPASDPVDGLIGLGIGVAGGRRDAVTGNLVTGSARYGIAVFTTVQPSGDVWRPSGNRVERNTVGGSGIADLALGAGASTGNCFESNDAVTSAPADLERTHSCDVTAPAGGDASVGRALEITTPVAYGRSGPHPPYTQMPRPPRQPSMPSMPSMLSGSPPVGDGSASASFGLPPADRPTHQSL
jgi:Right handed beta helix region